VENAFFKVWAWQIGGLKITPLMIIFPLTVVYYLFQVWRKFKNDYPQEAIIRFSLYTLLAFILSAGLVWLLGGKELSLLFGLLSLIISAVFFCRAYKWNSWSFLEGIMPSLLVGGMMLVFGLIFSPEEVVYMKKQNAAIQIIFLFIAWVSTKLMAGYRSFSWYPSGKAGFLFLAPLIIVFLLEGGLDFYLRNGLYWQSLASGLVAAVAGTIFFIRAKG